MRVTIPDTSGLQIKPDLMQRAIAADPEPEQFEGWLRQQCFAASPGEGGVRAMALSICEEWQLAGEADYFRDWLARGAPADDAPGDRAARNEGGLSTVVCMASSVRAQPAEAVS